MEPIKENIEKMEKIEEKESMFKKPWVQTLSGVSLVLIILISLLTYKMLSSSVGIDRSIISAPVIEIAPASALVLDEVYVKEGDSVTSGQNLARVGGEILSARVSGIIVEVNNMPGQVFSPASPVIKMIEPSELRIIGTIKENEGLSDIKVGESVSFTVDAFAGKKYTGIVESISATSKESGITFSISDKREIKEFEVKVKYDIATYPEFKNGMSAKMNVYK